MHWQRSREIHLQDFDLIEINKSTNELYNDGAVVERMTNGSS